jgi:hypothetical protein
MLSNEKIRWHGVFMVDGEKCEDLLVANVLLEWCLTFGLEMGYFGDENIF